MIEATSSLGSLSPTSGASSRRTELDQDAFLNLLVTQLQNQDPLSPLQAHEFASQLASFASVEQLNQLNDEMVFQTDNVMLAAQLSKTALSAALIGREILAEGNQVEISDSESAVIRLDVGAAGGNARLRLFDSSGMEVASRDLGNVSGGRQVVTLPSDLPAGTYTYELMITGPDGSEVSVTTYTSGVVDGVSFLNGQILLRVGSAEIPLDAVAEIEPAGVTTLADDVSDPVSPVIYGIGPGRPYNSSAA